MITLFLALFSFATFAHNYGSQETPPPFDGEAFSESAVTYEAVDWRNKGGKNWIGPVRNQANCGSCVAFATIATLEDQLTISSGLLWKREAFSQEALFGCGRGKCSSGWTVRSAAVTVETIGVVDVACAPYKAGSMGRDPVCSQFCENQSARTLKVKSSFHPENAAQVKEALKRGPLLTNMSVKAGFDGYTGGIFKSHIDDQTLGGHAVELVGFNDMERYWIIKNSWGEGWGENGFARVSYDDAQGIGGHTFGFEMNQEAGGFESPLEDQFVQGVMTIKGEVGVVELSQKGISLKKWDCKKNCSLNTSELSDGEYILSSQIGGGRVSTRRITVLNRPVAAVMSLSHPSSYNYSYPQSGRIYFDISLSGTIFPEAIVMQIKKGNTLVHQRIFRDVYAMNRIGYNTGSIPNGSYEFYFSHVTFNKASSAQMFKVTIKN